MENVFSKIMGTASTSHPHIILEATLLDTPLGSMIAIANNKALYLLEFVDRLGLKKEIDCLKKRTNAAILPGYTAITLSIETELAGYFNGTLKKFITPLFLSGSPFQKKVWHELERIAFGEKRSYTDLAKSIGNPTAYRAVAQANGANQLSLIIPCHRVINSNGKLGGYNGGIMRKEWLLNHEKKWTYNE